MPRLDWHLIPASLFVDTTSAPPSCPTIRHGLPAASAFMRVCAQLAYQRGNISVGREALRRVPPSVRYRRKLSFSKAGGMSASGQSRHFGGGLLPILTPSTDVNGV